MTNYGNRGMTFEKLIEFANHRYRHKGVAMIEKQNTKFIPIRDGHGAIATAKVEEKGTVDFMGRFRDVPIAFEAKHCSTDRIDLSRVEPHQCDFLRYWTRQPGESTKQPGIEFVLVSFRMTDFFLIPRDMWEAAIAARKAKVPGEAEYGPESKVWHTTGRASIRKDELPSEWRIVTGPNAVLEYLATVSRLWGGAA